MNCLFCKSNSDYSRSVEHIIPESLGNKEHILPKGIVCDPCNNYFATKIEKVLLDQPYFRSVRHRCVIESKKGNVPFEKGFQLSPFPALIDIYIEDGQRSIVFHDEKVISRLLTAKSGSFVIPIISEPEKNNSIMSRFLVKVSVEALLYWIKGEPDWIDEIMNKPELDEIKQYARYGSGVQMWPYHQRRIYLEEDLFLNPKVLDESYEILHEFKFFWTKEQEFYFVLAIMGIEYSINMGRPSIETYERWLIENNGRSILTSDQEQRVQRKT